MSTISASTTSTTAYQVTADTTGTLVLQTGSTPTTAMTIDTSQNVGIGTSSPVTKLTMAGNIAFSGDQSLTWNTYSNAGDKYIANGYAAQFYYNPSAGTLRYLNAGNNVSGAGAAASLTDRFAIDTSGNVGIGTSSPSCRLDVQNATQKTSLTGTGFGVLNLKSTTATGDYAALTFSSSAGVPGAVMAYQQTASGGAIAFGISNNYGSGITSEAARIDSSANLQFNSGYGSVATAYGCRAWVNFNGTGTVAIRASGNVSSITDNGVGNYTVNFTNAMPDANFSSPCSTNASGSGGVPYAGITAKSTSSCTLQTTNASATVDNSDNTVAIFR